jgi:hypothetical protein
MANGMVEMERHSSVYLPPGAPTKRRRLEMSLRRYRSSENQAINPGMTGLQTREIQTLF